MNKNLRNRLLIIIAVVAASLLFTFKQEINLGLDLKGGMHLIYRVKTEELDKAVRNDAVLRAIEILRNRVDSMGVGEPVIQRQGDNQILIQLPGVTDRDKALKLLGTVAQLKFMLVNEDEEKLTAAKTGNIPSGFQLLYIKRDDDSGKDPILLEEKGSLKGDIIEDAQLDLDTQSFNQYKITFKLKSEGTKDFGKMTQKNKGRRLAIVMDNTVISAPNIREEILGGRGEINGNFDYEEASVLSLALRSGSLPAGLEVEEERTIGPLLGKDSIKDGITATVIGGISVVLFMLIYYMTAGIISDIALVINLLLIFGIMGFLNATLPNSPLTLTLPGIAGIILTLGMAVDANVLINERIREEINTGKPIQAAINNGFSKALKAIIDSNTTTLIAAFMLFQFGSGPIKGFAVTLSIGLISSLFTALFVTKTFFMLFYQMGFLKSIKMLTIFENINIDFISKRFICFFISAILVVASIIALINKKDTAYGIDFAGGQIQEYKFERPIQTEEIRAALQSVNLKDVIIQKIIEEPEKVLIKTDQESYEQVSSAFAKTFPNNKVELLRVEQVGPVVGKALRKDAILAFIFALIGILIYVGFRFKHFDFATAGVIALLHDVLVTLGIIVMLNRQIDLLVVTALLTIAGYSINDTIIIYDRVRENWNKLNKKSLSEVINISINQTLGRTILTTVTTLLVVITLFLKGGEILNTFALCLIIGFITGTYSTIFIASPLVLAWERKNKK